MSTEDNNEGCINPGFGRPYGHNPMVTDTGIEVWMWRKGQKVRFFDCNGQQVGPEHANVVPALLSVWKRGWRCKDHPKWLQDGCIKEAQAST